MYFVERFPSQFTRLVNRLSLVRPHGSGAVTVFTFAPIVRDREHGKHGSSPSVVSQAPPEVASLVGWYPFAAAAVSVTRSLVDLLHIAPSAGSAGASATSIATEHPGFWLHMNDAAIFSKLFALTMLALDTSYATSDNLTIDDFFG